MRKSILGFCVGIVVLGYSLSTVTTSAAPAKFYISDEITIDGPALFFGVAGDARQELWSVYCAQPLRSCVARAPGLVLRIDNVGSPWLIAATSQGAAVSVLSRDTLHSSPRLFTQPLDSSMIKRLSQNTPFVIVKEDGKIVLQTATAGIDRVIDYLTWIQGNTARTLRDARLWPRNGDIRVQDMTPEVLERYDIMQRRALAAQRQLDPRR